MITEETYDTAADWLKEIRAAYRLPMEDLARIAGETVPVIQAALIGGAHRSDAVLLKIAQAFDFDSLEDVCLRGESAVTRIQRRGVDYSDRDTVSPPATLKIESAKKPPVPKKSGTAISFFLTPEQRKLWGSALRMIIGVSDLTIPELATAIDMNKKTLESALAGASEPSLKIISGYFSLSRKEAIQQAGEILFKCMYQEHFGEILKQYRQHAEPPLTQTAAGKKLFPNYNDSSALQTVSHLERGNIKPGYKMTLSLLRGFGFDNMHQFIHAAGLSEQYPNPAAREVATAARIDELLSAAQSEKDLNLPMRELVRRRNARDGGEPSL